MDNILDSATDAAREVLSLANIQFAGLAQVLGHEFPGTEHLLIGLVFSDDAWTTQVFTEAGYDLSLLRERALEFASSGGGNAPVADRLHNVITDAIGVAHARMHRRLDNVHLLRALLERPGCSAMRVLNELGSIVRLSEALDRKLDQVRE